LNVSRVTPAQTSFNGGEISRRLRARIEQSLYGISVAAMTGWAPLVEGPAEAMPGTIHVMQAPGPVRLLRFEPNATQGHVIEAGAGQFRFYTNDALMVDGSDNPLSVASPYDWAAVQALNTHHSYDALYLFHDAHQLRQLVRTDAGAFQLDLVTLENGPFEDRNKDKAIKVSASALTGAVAMTATAAIFVASDVGSLFMLEAEDLGDTPAWEPGLSVTAGQLRVSMERVYRAVSTGRTGGFQPSHTEGVEWDGSGQGTDINGAAAGGVQWEYLHDKYGILRITGFTSGTEVAATVLRHLPFSAVGDYAYEGGYWDPAWGTWVPPTSGVSYAYGTWRWRFGAYSNTRGWPQCGCIWRERLCLAKDNRVDLSVAGDIHNFAIWNELGDISADMAVSGRIDDPNPITALAPDDQLLIYNAIGVFTLGQDHGAQPFGPQNRRFRRQHNGSSGDAAPVLLDSRTLHIDRTGGRIFETDIDPSRNVEVPIDLTRYARHMGNSARRLTGLAVQTHPHNHVWACRADGSMAAANYLPDEQVLGWANRQMADGMAVQNITSITDPDGLFDQIWLAATMNNVWHVLRMAPWRGDGEYDQTAVMVDFAHIHDGAPQSSFNVPMLAARTVHVVADGRMLPLEVGPAGAITLPDPASRVVIGLPFPAFVEGLPIEAGGDSGPAISKMARISRSWIKVLDGRGLEAGVTADMQPLQQLADGYVSDSAFDPERGFRFIECTSDHVREPFLRVERVMPSQCTLLAWGCTVEVQQK
jgi:hypothetical protein